MNNQRLLLGVGVALTLALGILMTGPYFMAIMSVVSHSSMWFLDTVLGGRLARGAPFLMWGITGAIFGLTMGAWMMAPAYGLRKYRSLLILPPLLLVAGFSLASLTH